jgi:hypothetical protein
MRVNLFSDYRGVLTGEQFYEAGVIEVSEETALALVTARRAVYVDAPGTPMNESEAKPRAKKAK